jgi:hypothetical protein
MEKAMLVFASNLTTRDPKINRILRKIDLKNTREEIQELARQCVVAGADVLDINLQQHHDRPKVMQFLVKALPELFDSSIKTPCWLGNALVGALARLRAVIETELPAMLSVLGLSSVFLDVLKRENMRMVRLLKVLNNKVIYSDGELEI